MRIIKSLINSFASVASYALVALAGIGVRKLFLSSFSIEYLGYESLFGSIFTLLSMAEMGSGSLFSYKLYDALAKKDMLEISVLMTMYKHIYRIVGITVSIAGSLVFLFLPLMINTNGQDLVYVKTVYLAQFATTLTTYFLAYKRSVIVADQCEYQVVQLETGFKLLNQPLRAIAIIIFKSYVAYIIVSVITNLATNVCIAYKCKKKYPYISNENVTAQDYRSRNIFVELKNLFISKISTTIYSSSDNVLITVLLGITTTALYGNYALINGIVCGIIWKITMPLGSSIGNMIYMESKENSYKFYQAYNLLFVFIAGFAFTSFIVLFQPTITYLFGSKYFLSQSFVVFFCLNNYVSLKQQATCAYRDALGNYALDRNYSIASAVINVFLSIVLGYVYGISGIVFATALGHCAIWFGRIKTVDIHFYNKSLRSVFVKEIFDFCLIITEAAITYMICKGFDNTLSSIILRLIICVIVSSSINLVVCCRRSEFVIFLDYAKKVLSVIKKF